LIDGSKEISDDAVAAAAAVVDAAVKEELEEHDTATAAAVAATLVADPTAGIVGVEHEHHMPDPADHHEV
jgi:hypothetical protein